MKDYQSITQIYPRQPLSQFRILGSYVGEQTPHGYQFTIKCFYTIITQKSVVSEDLSWDLRFAKAHVPRCTAMFYQTQSD